jgi:Leucine rich repeat
MKFYYQLTFLCLIFGYLEAAHNCTSFNDKNHGYGCELKNVKPQEEVLEITVMAKENDNKTESDVVWVQIRDSQLDNLPKGVFEKFLNMEKIMIISSKGFQNLNLTYFDKKIKLVLMKSTDLEIIGENSFTGLEELKTLSLNYNNVKKVHKLAFRDLVNVEKIEMVFNSIEFLDDETFARNVNLKLVLLYNNQLKVLSTQLFGKNINIESLQLQNNAISQIEKGFQTTLKSLTRADFSNNVCINENIQISRYVQWSSHQYKFKDCFNNYALLKATNDDVLSVKGKMDDLELKVAGSLERIDSDLFIMEGKMENSTALDEVKTNLIKFFESDRKNLTHQFDNDLNNITSHVKTNMMEEIQKKLEKRQEAQQEKLVSHEVKDIHDELNEKFRTIYWLLFAVVCFSCITTLFVFHKLNVFQIPLYNGYNTRNERHLIDPEH